MLAQHAYVLCVMHAWSHNMIQSRQLLLMEGYEPVIMLLILGKHFASMSVFKAMQDQPQQPQLACTQTNTNDTRHPTRCQFQMRVSARLVMALAKRDQEFKALIKVLTTICQSIWSQGLASPSPQCAIRKYAYVCTYMHMHRQIRECHLESWCEPT